MTENDIYISTDNVKKEVWNRWNNKALRLDVERYLGNNPPEFFGQALRAVIFRNIISPDVEFANFYNVAKSLQLSPLGFSYIEDRFCTRNSDKLCLAKLAIFEKRDKYGNAIFHYKKLIEIKENDNRVFSEIKTMSGELLVDYHRKLLHDSFPDMETYDMSKWIFDNGQTAEEYYKKFLAFFVCHGVLFENFLFSGEERQFSLDVVMPAFDLIYNKFGLRPMVLPAIPVGQEEDGYWWCYNEAVFK